VWPLALCWSGFKWLCELPPACTQACNRCLKFMSLHLVRPLACLPMLTRSPIRAALPAACRSCGVGRLPVPPGPQLGQARSLLRLLWPPDGHPGPPAAALCAGCHHLAGQRAHAVAAAQPHVRGECPLACLGWLGCVLLPIVPRLAMPLPVPSVDACPCACQTAAAVVCCLLCCRSYPSLRCCAPWCRCSTPGRVPASGTTTL
jgi:hypothetical protein